MEIKLSKKQFECLIKTVDVGSSIYGILGDRVSEYYQKQSDEINDLLEYLLDRVGDFGAEAMIEKFNGKTLICDELSEELETVMQDYNDESFWFELPMRLGKRDFARTITEAEKKEIVRRGGWLPERIHEIYQKWEKELEKNGIDRLEIVGDTSKKVGPGKP